MDPNSGGDGSRFTLPVSPSPAINISGRMQASCPSGGSYWSPWPSRQGRRLGTVQEFAAGRRWCSRWNRSVGPLRSSGRNRPIRLGQTSGSSLASTLSRVRYVRKSLAISTHTQAGAPDLARFGTA